MARRLLPSSFRQGAFGPDRPRWPRAEDPTTEITLLCKLCGLVCTSIEDLNPISTSHTTCIEDRGSAWSPPWIVLENVCNRALLGVVVCSPILFEQRWPGDPLSRAMVEVGIADAIAIAHLATNAAPLENQKQLWPASHSEVPFAHMHVYGSIQPVSGKCPWLQSGNSASMELRVGGMIMDPCDSTRATNMGHKATAK
eukprot:CAMPEP_0115453320 /NCGR_PEP_ID=MMETSP0271-20121206/43051_1 /TAXON_ID=71861 /ORGANISM="Scrippsiella trochoidea, Strain CCMP3099" /LENGTH=197 /DNA_ID=CAMNT_0002879679 /DNA_START=579 /DNA_END=1173 /DNA_ORIENTATION=+